MSNVSVAEAKARFAQLVHQAESGQAVRITRRGRAVAVLVSEADYLRLTGSSGGLLAFTKAWRAQAAHAGVVLPDIEAWQGLRDQSERAPLDMG